MAINTPLNLRNQVIYGVYVRNHKGEGTFQDVATDLDRIKDLGVDIIWLMPIHPIGVKNKKGSLGCPYAIRDYRGINPEYGDIDSFSRLVNRIHSMGMKCLIDVVFHHTSPDSILYETKPEFFYRKLDGNVGNKVGEWSDVIDLDFSNKELWYELIDSLKLWVNLGVDGFRCDVASLIPIDFWLLARSEIEKINKDFIWLTESVEPNFITFLREEGLYAASDSEIFNAFDIAYDYDVYPFFRGYIEGRNTLEEYLEKIRQQEYIYPNNYVKLRFLENHDQPRIKSLIPTKDLLMMWTAFLYFQKGAILLYAGQEVMEDKTPSLFDRDPVNWSLGNDDFTSFIKTLYSIKQKTIFSNGNYKIHKTSINGVIYASYINKASKIIGIFNVEAKAGRLSVDFSDGNYINLIDDSIVEVKDGKLKLTNYPIIIEINESMYLPIS